MPELFLKLWELHFAGEVETARELQYDINNIIYKLCSGKGHMYAMIKETLKKRVGLDIGGGKAPFYNLVEADYAIADEAVAMINAAIKKYIG